MVAVASFAARAENREAALGRITADVTYLASDALEGRGVETAGNEKAAEHVRAAFEAAAEDVPSLTYRVRFTTATAPGG